jgi:hypothetical protein
MLLFTILRCITNSDYLSPTAALTNPINKSLHARLIIALLYQLLVYIDPEDKIFLEFPVMKEVN